MVRLTDRPDMTLDVCRGRKQQHNKKFFVLSGNSIDTHGIDIKTIQYLIKIKKIVSVITNVNLSRVSLQKCDTKIIKQHYINNGTL